MNEQDNGFFAEEMHNGRQALDLVGRLLAVAEPGAVYGPPISSGDRTVILMGSERAGLPPEHQRGCDRMVSIPMVGRVDSLHLAVATGLVLYEVLEHRRRAGRA